MDKEKGKILACISRLKFLTEDWSKVTTLEMEEQAERLIIAKSAELLKLAEPKKSCDCGEDVEAMEEWAKTVDVFLKAATKLANQKKF